MSSGGAAPLPGDDDAPDETAPDAAATPAETTDPALAAATARLAGLAETGAVLAAVHAHRVRQVDALARGWACTHRRDHPAGAPAAAPGGGPDGGPDGGPSGFAHDSRDLDPVTGLCHEVLHPAAAVVAAHLRLTHYGAAQLITCATRLTHAFPDTLAALETGAVDWERVKVVLRESEDLDPALHGALDEALCSPDEADEAEDGEDGEEGEQGEDGGSPPALETTTALTTAELAVHVREVIAALDAAGVRERSRTKTARRHVRARALADGMGELVVYGPAPAVEEMRCAIVDAGEQSRLAARERTRHGQPSQDPWALPEVDGFRDARGIDAHRFDAAHGLVTHGRCRTSHDDAGEAGGAGSLSGEDAPSTSTSTSTRVRRASASAVCRAGGPAVMIAFTTALGLDDLPGRLEGWGLVPGWMGRAMAAHRRSRRILLDEMDGVVIGVDGHTHPAGTFTVVPEDGDDDESGEDPGGRDPGGGGPGSGPPPAPSPPRSPARDRGLAPGRPPDGSRQGCVPLDPDACPTRTAGTSTAGSAGTRRPERYVPPAALARLVVARWGTCSHPGCRRRASACDLDHVLAWPVGPTCGCNLAPLCPRHHLLKHATLPPRRGGPAVVWAQSSGSMVWPWRVWRCALGHQHWDHPSGVSRVSAPRPALPVVPATTMTGAAAGVIGPVRPLLYPARAFRREGAITTTAPITTVSSWAGLPDTPPF